ncbi:MAG: hypothetical protein ABGZ19_07905 [Verrucomicrobiales bacterium]
MDRLNTLAEDQQNRIRQVLFELMKSSNIPFSGQAANAYFRINPGETQREIERMKANPKWREFVDILPSYSP